MCIECTTNPPNLIFPIFYPTFANMPTAVFTEAQYNALLAAYASGQLTVEYADKKVTYRSLADMERILNLMNAQLNPSAAASRVRHTSFQSGHFPTT